MSGGDVVALLNQVLSRLAVIEAKVGVEGGSSGSSESGSSLPPRIAAFDTYCANHLEPFVSPYRSSSLYRSNHYPMNRILVQDAWLLLAASA